VTVTELAICQEFTDNASGLFSEEKAMKRLAVGVLGATGLVGQRMLAMLDDHPWFDVVWVAGSPDSVGKDYDDATEWMIEADKPAWAGEAVLEPCLPVRRADLVFSALPSDVAAKVEVIYAEAGIPVFTNTSANRMVADVPLLIPEVNADHLALLEVQRKRRGWDRGCIVANPNCSTTGIVLAVAPISRLLNRLSVTTEQSVSGAGKRALASLAGMDNTIPFINGEEAKIETETRKLLGWLHGGRVMERQFEVWASCMRSGRRFGHMASVELSFCGPVSPEQIMEAWQTFMPLAELDLPTLPRRPIVTVTNDDRPQPRWDLTNGNGMSVTVGRLRQSGPCGARFFVLSDNLGRGAAGAAIANAELCVAKGLI
jgi:aspartate-semialdehyde dehydrogenase